MANSGALSLGQVAGYWEAAGGPGTDDARIAALIATSESRCNPGAIEQGYPYATTGWGLWQITPGDSEPQAGVDYELLSPYKNAIAAVAKYRSGGGWGPWKGDPNYERYVAGHEAVPQFAIVAPGGGGTAGGTLPSTPVHPVATGTKTGGSRKTIGSIDPGEWTPSGTAPAGTHNTSSPGSGSTGASSTGSTGSSPVTVHTVPQPSEGTGLSLLDMLLSPGSLGEGMIRAAEVLLGAALIAVAIVAFAFALTGRDVAPSQLVAGLLPGGKKIMGATWGKK